MKNKYRKGANFERMGVLHHASVKTCVFAGRFASSKCKGKLKVDVVALHVKNGKGILYIEQYKKTKVKKTKEISKFLNAKLPKTVKLKPRFITYITIKLPKNKKEIK